MKRILYLLGIILILSAESCKDCESAIIQSNVSDIYVPDSLFSGETIPITVLYNIPESCYSFHSFEETINGFQWNIDLKLLHDECNACFTVATTESAVYNFTPILSGTYILEFGSNLLSDTLIVN